MFLSRTLFAIADIQNALARLPHAAPRRRAVCGRSGVAVWAKRAGWVWEEKAKGKELEGGEREKQNEEEHAHEADEQPPFALRDFTRSIPRGTLVAVVGRVGSGKSSLLQGLIGRCAPPTPRQVGVWRDRGVLSVVGVDPECDCEGQHARRAAVRGGQALTSHRGFVFAPGFAAPHRWGLDGGTLLAGGQKQRVNIARALYYGVDMVIFEDPLSAVDGNVRKALFRSAIQGLVAQDKTVLLVAHALHFLVQCDYIYTLDGARIAETGTYPELIARGGEFARLERGFGGAKADDAGGKGAGAGEDGDGDEAQFVEKDIDIMDIFRVALDNALLCPFVSRLHCREDPAIVAKRTELAQRMKMLEGVRKDLVAFEQRNRRGQRGIPLARDCETQLKSTTDKLFG
ncbi:P-loop containing nucleoside triphosphate hydrolase protein [Mycena leptocephala]|nr:P-loop containing nucleoside triphosphate hydrolase protein [Mycena leptocephala]